MAASNLLVPIAEDRLEATPIEASRSTRSVCPLGQLLEPRTAPLEEDYLVTSRVLGSGMSGDVKLATHRETGERVAVKSFDLEGMSESAEDDMCREMTVHASLEHPNVVKALDIFVSDKHVHIVTEALEGGTLLDRILKVRMLGEYRSRLVVEQVLQAVEYMHDLGFVHRDIKLQNVVYKGDVDTVKLIDFGLCRKWQDGQKPMQRRCGTLGYMAPEVMKSCYTNKADMWSVGVVAHAVLTGQDLGRDEEGAPVLSDNLKKCSVNAQAFVKALLTADPEARPSASEALAHRWMRPTNPLKVTPHQSRFGTGATESTTDTGTQSIPQHVLTMLSLHDSFVSEGDSTASVTSETTEQEAELMRSALPRPEPPRPAGRTAAWGASRIMSSLWSAMRRRRSADRRVRPELYAAVMPSAGAR